MRDTQRDAARWAAAEDVQAGAFRAAGADYTPGRFPGDPGMVGVGVQDTPVPGVGVTAGALPGIDLRFAQKVR